MKARKYEQQHPNSGTIATTSLQTKGLWHQKWYQFSQLSSIPLKKCNLANFIG